MSDNAEDAGRNPFRMLAETEMFREGGAESFAESAANLDPDTLPQHTRVIMDRVETNLAALSPTNLPAADIPGLERVSQQEWDEAYDLFLLTANAMFQNLKSGKAPSRKDTVVAEAVIIADETRPSFLLCDGKVDVDDPLGTHWQNQIAAAKGNGVQSIAKAVGRIQPKHGGANVFYGTGNLIAHEPGRDTGLILTNYHVIRDARRHGVAMTDKGTYWKVEDHLEIDFLGEWCSVETNRFRITKVFFPQGVGAVFAGIDAAVAEIERIDGEGDFPIPVANLSPHASLIVAEIGSLATVGFPQRPDYKNDGALNDTQWGFVIKTLFQNLFGVKRLAPGRRIWGLGSHRKDTGKRAIGHDASTFAGASGSLVFAWQQFEAPAFCLHFAGGTRSANYALSFHKEQAALAAIGVPLG